MWGQFAIGKVSLIIVAILIAAVGLERQSKIFLVLQQVALEIVNVDLPQLRAIYPVSNKIKSPRMGQRLEVNSLCHLIWLVAAGSRKYGNERVVQLPIEL